MKKNVNDAEVEVVRLNKLVDEMRERHNYELETAARPYLVKLCRSLGLPIYERPAKHIEDEIRRLRDENDTLRTELNKLRGDLNE